MPRYVSVPFKAIPELVRHYRAVQKLEFRVRENYKSRSDGYANASRDFAASRRSWVSNCLQAVLQEHLSRHMTIDYGLRQVAGQWCVPSLYEDGVIRFCEGWDKFVKDEGREPDDKEIVHLIRVALDGGIHR